MWDRGSGNEGKTRGKRDDLEEEKEKRKEEKTRKRRKRERGDGPKEG